MQKSRRRDFLDYSRKIVEGEVWEESGEGGEMEDGYDEVDTTEDKEEKMVNCNKAVYSIHVCT